MAASQSRKCATNDLIRRCLVKECLVGLPSRDIKRDKPHGTNGAEFAVFSLIFAEFCRFSVSLLEMTACQKRRFSQEPQMIAENRRKPQNLAETCLFHVVCSFNSSLRADFREGDANSNLSVFRVRRFSESPGTSSLNCLSC